VNFRLDRSFAQRYSVPVRGETPLSERGTSMDFQGPMHGMATGNFAALGILFFLLWVIVMVAFIATWIIVLVAVWRGMKAHERVADALESLARNRLEPPR
jgi:uncharacterized membrane protein